MSAPAGLIRHLPNVLSALRIAAAPILVALALAHRETAFSALLVPALVSDIVDGYLARRLGLTSALGALLDSIADLALFAASTFGVWCFHPEILAEHRISGLVLIAGWLLEPLIAVLRYGRISSFHTYASKVAAYLLGFMIAVLFIWGLQPALFYTAVGTGIAATIEEMLLIAVLPGWRSNVRGLWWVLRETRVASS